MDLIMDEEDVSIGYDSDRVGANRVQIMTTGPGTELNFSLRDAWEKYNPVTVTKTLISDPKKAIQQYNPYSIIRSVTNINTVRDLWDKYANPLQKLKSAGDIASDVIGTPESRQASWDRIKTNVTTYSKLVGLAAPRASFYVLVTQNVFGLASKLNDEKKSNPENYNRIVYVEWPRLGGNSEKLIKAIDKGKWRQEKRADSYEQESTFMKWYMGLRTGGAYNLLKGETFKVDGNYLNVAEPVSATAVTTAIVAATPIVIKVMDWLKQKAKFEQDQQLIDKLAAQQPPIEGDNDFANLPDGTGLDDQGVIIGLSPTEFLMIGGGLAAALTTIYFITKIKK
jgi:hypothetical protein